MTPSSRYAATPPCRRRVVTGPSRSVRPSTTAEEQQQRHEAHAEDPWRRRTGTNQLPRSTASVTSATGISTPPRELSARRARARRRRAAGSRRRRRRGCGPLPGGTSGGMTNTTTNSRTEKTESPLSSAQKAAGATGRAERRTWLRRGAARDAPRRSGDAGRAGARPRSLVAVREERLARCRSCSRGCTSRPAGAQHQHACGDLALAAVRDRDRCSRGSLDGSPHAPFTIGPPTSSTRWPLVLW